MYSFFNTLTLSCSFEIFVYFCFRLNKSKSLNKTKKLSLRPFCVKCQKSKECLVYKLKISIHDHRVGFITSILSWHRTYTYNIELQLVSNNNELNSKFESKWWTQTEFTDRYFLHFSFLLGLLFNLQLRYVMWLL